MAAAVKPEIRPARADDLPCCAEVVVEALADLARREGRTATTPDAAALMPLLRFAHQQAPDAFHVAADENGIVGFGGAWPRDGLWWLGYLFVLPAHQSSGVGASLLARTLAPGAGAPCTFTFASGDARAVALYMRHGMMPRAAVLTLGVEVGEPEPPQELRLAPLRGSTLAFERARFGYARGLDHRFFMQHGAGFALLRPDDARAGFMYVGANGRVGPVACEDAADVAPALQLALCELARRDVRRATLRVPHANEAALRWCAGHGATVEATNLLMASAPLAPMDLVLLGNPGLA